MSYACFINLNLRPAGAVLSSKRCYAGSIPNGYSRTIFSYRWQRKQGLIIPIGNWVIDEACRQLREWHLQGHTDWSIAVNLSTLQFEQPSLVKTVLDCLTRHSVPPGMLITGDRNHGNEQSGQSVRVLTALTDAELKPR